MSPQDSSKNKVQTVKVNGETYTVNIVRARELGALRGAYCVGDIFVQAPLTVGVDNYLKRIFVLTETEVGRVALVDLKGSRLTSGVAVQYRELSNTEIYRVMDASVREYVYISNPRDYMANFIPSLEPEVAVIIVNDVTYYLDIDKARKLGLLTSVVPPVEPKIGDYFTYSDVKITFDNYRKNTYVLIQSEKDPHGYALFGLVNLLGETLWTKRLTGGNLNYVADPNAYMSGIFNPTDNKPTKPKISAEEAELF